jgi:AraC family transcriptional activator of tynA and feaB
MHRSELTIQTQKDAAQFCDLLNETHASNDMRLNEDHGAINAQCIYRANDDVIITDLRQMFGCAYERTRKHISRDGSDTVFIHINTGRSLLAARQRDRDYVLGQGMAGLYVNNAPISLELKPGADVIGINLPRSMTVDWCKTPEDVAIIDTDPSHPALHMLTTYIRFMLDAETIDADTCRAMHGHIGELAGLWLCGLKPRDWRDHGAQSRQQARYHAIKGRLQQDFFASDVSALSVGRGLGLSERTVQQVMTQAGTSFSRALNDIRSEKAREMLSDPRHGSTPVITIAMACGFNDLSTFYRAFKARYDEAPGAFRPQ